MCDPSKTQTDLKLYHVDEDIASLSPKLQSPEVNLLRQNDLPALTGQCLVDLLTRQS